MKGLARDVALGNGAWDNALTANLADRDEAGVKVLVKSGSAAIGERANFGDTQVARFERSRIVTSGVLPC